MTLHAVYLFNLDSNFLMTEVFESHPDLLLGPSFTKLVTIIQNQSKELLGEEIELIRIKGLNYHLRNFHSFHIAIACETEGSHDLIMEKISRAFSKKYKQQMDNLEDVSVDLDDFREEIHLIIQHESQFGFSHPLDPTKTLDTVTIFYLPKALQQTALVITTLQMGTVREIARQMDEDPAVVKGYLAILQQEGYVGVIERGARSMYFATS